MENTKEIFHRLLSLPLFSGLSYDDIIEIAGHARLDFHEVSAGEVIARDGEPNNRVVFMITGTVTATTSADDKGYSITEYLNSPFAFQPETIFGRRQYFAATLTTATPCSYLVLTKADLLKVGDVSEVFKLNMLSFIAACSQDLYRRLWHVPPRNAADAIVRFVAYRCTKPAGKKVIRIKQPRLALETGCSALAISSAVSSLKAEGLIHHSRGEIIIPAMEKLIKRMKESVSE